MQEIRLNREEKKNKINDILKPILNRAKEQARIRSHPIQGLNIESHPIQIDERLHQNSHKHAQKVIFILPKTKQSKELRIVPLPKELKLKVSEHSHGKIFGSKHRTYRQPGAEEKSSLIETCPCCVGVLDLDEAATLAKVGSATEGHESGLNHINPIPSGGLEWATSVFGGYFSLAGLYFGYINFTGVDERMEALETMSKQNQKEIKEIKARDPKSQEIRNLECYQKTIDYSKFDGVFTKWLGGAAPMVGSAGMFGSLIYSPITAPALGVMSGYSLAYVLRYGRDLHRINRVDLKSLKKYNKPNQVKGFEIFKDRVKKKKGFFKSVMASWGAYGSGAGMLAASAICGLLGVAFPLPALAVGAALLIAGVFATLYHNNINVREYAPKNQNAIDRRYLGAESDVLVKLCTNDKQAKLAQAFKDKLQSNLNKKLPKQSAFLNLKRAQYFIGMTLTLGVPGFIRLIKRNNEKRFSHYQELPQIKAETRKDRIQYFTDNIKEQLEYMAYLKENFNDIEPSFMKKFYDFRNTDNHLNSEEMKGEFARYLDFEMKNKAKLREDLLNSKEKPSNIDDFNNLWCFSFRNGMIKTVFEKVFDHLKDNKLLDKYKALGYISVEKDDEDDGHHCDHDHDHDHDHTHEEDSHDHKGHGGHSHSAEVITFNKEKFAQDLASKKQEALDFYDLINEKADHAIAFDLKDQFEYHRAELCNHLEEMTRK